MLPLDDLTPLEQAHLDIAERFGKQATRIYDDELILTPRKIDALAEANAKRIITHKDYPMQQQYSKMFLLFIRVFVDAFSAYQRTYK